MDATSAVLENMALIQALSAPMLVALLVLKDSFKTHQVPQHVIFVRVLSVLDLATKVWQTLVVLEFHQDRIKTEQEFSASVKKDTSAWVEVTAARRAH